jgi:hypothetical protein
LCYVLLQRWPMYQNNVLATTETHGDSETLVAKIYL